MFKIESYVTPILLSYVDKYVRDFKPADAQVSLWGGGVALHNLVLKADVLQQELSLPFLLVSGRIHELLIQVPWTKIMSEPIIITIDTIECVLSLRPPAQPDEPPATDTTQRRAQVVEAPPGYMQALVRRIVSNISLRIHHLIVKYVEDDIVLSLNVKHLAIDSADANWAAAFADIDQAVPMLRRLVQLEDLTLCLDRADSDGKIRFYQEPVLYRCQLNLRVLTKLVSANTRRAIGLSVHLRSSKLTWSLTSDQLTLLLRLLRERPPVDVTKPPPPTNSPHSPPAISSDLQGSPLNSAEPVRTGSWSEWAWSWLPAWSDRDENPEEGVEDTPASHSPNPMHFTACLDSVSVVFKVTEVEPGGRKKTRSILELCADHAAVKGLLCSPTTIQVCFGARSVQLRSNGRCVCGHIDLNTISEEPTVYLSRLEPVEAAWDWPPEAFAEHDVEQCTVEDPEYNGPESLSPESESKPNQENTSEKSVFREFWNKLAPVVFVHLLHERAPPESTANPYENPPTMFEFSDWIEHYNMKVKIQPLDVQICTGLVHRLVAIGNIFKDLPATPAPEIPKRTLTIEECDALSDNLPQKCIEISCSGVRFRIVPWDHSVTDRPTPPKVELHLNTRKTNVIITGPMYPLRVCTAASQMPKDFGILWQGSRFNVTASMTWLHASLAPLPPLSSQTARPVARADIHFVSHSLLHPELFAGRESVEFSYTLKFKEINVCGSAARLQAACQVIHSLVQEASSFTLRHTSLINDAICDEESVAVDLNIEDFSVRGYVTGSVRNHILVIHSARATVLHKTDDEETKQAWLFSGPDAPTPSPYCRIAIQWCKEPISNSLDYFGFWSEPTAMCIDPLFIAWLAYKPQLRHTPEPVFNAPRTMSSTQYLRRRYTPPSSGRGVTRSPSAELVHSSRPRSQGSSSEPSEKKKAEPVPAKPTIPWWGGERLLAIHDRLKHLLFSVELGLVVLYVTTNTASAVDCATVRDAMERHAAASQRVIAFSFGHLALNCSAVMKSLWQEIRHDGPTFLSSKLPNDEDSFPWKLKLSDMSCYTLEVHPETDTTGREKSATGLRSQLKIKGSVTTRTVLELVTTTLTLSVVTKTAQKRTHKKHDQHKKHTENSSVDDSTKYFMTGQDFKPTSLKEFVRGPSRKKKDEEDASGAQTKPEPKEPVEKTQGPVVSLGIHLHADTPPIIVRLDQEQVHILGAALHCFAHLLTLLRSKPPPAQRHAFTSAFNNSHRSLIRSVSELDEIGPSPSVTSENPSEALIPIFESETSIESRIKTFLWFQWVVSRATLVIATDLVKLVFNVDDIISTVDLQEHYNQFKVKVASASVRHYERSGADEWKAAVLGGRVLEAREPSNPKEDNHFLAITITQARISNLPASWKEELHPKIIQSKNVTDTMWEIYATLAPLEAILRPSIIENTMCVIAAMMPRSYCTLQAEEPKKSTKWQWPFLYIAAGGLRLLVYSDNVEEDTDDTFMFVIGKVEINPHPENPICRRSVTAPDTGLGTWATAGGYEGRQYEVFIRNVGVQSAHFQQIVNKEVSETNIQQGTSGENPALKWTQPPVSPVITPVLHPLEITCVYAPAMYTSGALVCGPAFELNLVSDCAVELSMDQLKLSQELFIAFASAMSDSQQNAQVYADDNHGTCPYAEVLEPKPSVVDESAETISILSEVETTRTARTPNKSVGQDSGVETVTSASHFAQASFKKSVSIAFIDEAEASEHMEVFVTVGVVAFSLYMVDDGSPKAVALRIPNTAVPPKCATEEEIQPELKTSDNKGSSLGKKSRSITEAIRTTNIKTTRLQSVSPNARQAAGMLPLLHVSLHQPNIYFYKKKAQRNLQVSLFNAWVGLGADKSDQHWHLAIFNTAKGEADPVTDIPPALATLKLVAPTNSGASLTSLTHRGKLSLDLERPVQIQVCSDRLRRLKIISSMVTDILMTGIGTEKKSEEPPSLYGLRNFMVGQAIECITIQTTQIGLTGSKGAIGWADASLQIAAGIRPERIIARAFVNAFLVSRGPPDEDRHPLINPMIFGFEAEALWEAWRRSESGLSYREPTVRVAVEMDRVIIDARPEDLVTAVELKNTIENVIGKHLKTPTAPSKEEEPSTSGGMFEKRFSTETERSEHYYKDDLRSGAYRIISGGHLPVAYQVKLHGSAVSWRYPHPRAITRLIAFPLPDQDEEVECVLEHYNAMLSRWEPYSYFTLPVAEPREVRLYANPPDMLFAVLWRCRPCMPSDDQCQPFVFRTKRFMPRNEPLLSDPQEEECIKRGDVTAERLLAVLRVDSYFSPRLLPKIRSSFRIASIEAYIHNSLPTLSSQATALEGYYLSKPLVKSHRVLALVARDTLAHAVDSYSSESTLMISSELLSEIFNCGTGTMDLMLEPSRIQFALSLRDQTLEFFRSRFRTSPIKLAINVPELRTLQSLTQDWTAAIEMSTSAHWKRTNRRHERERPKRVVAEEAAAALDGRVSYWIHNSCAFALRVGQEGVDEVVPLAPGARFAYRWRCPVSPKKLRFSLNDPSDNLSWSSSVPFKPGSYRARLHGAEALLARDAPGCGVFAHVQVEETAARRSMRISGRLSLANMMRHNLLYKVRALCKETKNWRTVNTGELNPETVGRTVLCAADCDMALKLKLSNHETGWSGDIPLKECPKENVPWLVKIPSEGDIPYISVWCRVVRARGDGRILATIWPLYVLRSHLPLDTDVLITTDVSQASPTELHAPPLLQTAPGRGVSTHLYPPGTTTAKHSLTFQYRNIECPVTREAVPLHYGVTDASVFEKKVVVNNIDEILQETVQWLETFGAHAEMSWPYSIVTGHWHDAWKPALMQPRCDITVRYEAVRVGGGCCLEMQLCPKMLLCNATTIALTLRAHDATPLCKLEPGAAISPSSALLDKPFFMSIELGRETFVSGQLAVWHGDPGRYGVPPPGQVALDRPARLAIHCGQKVALLTLYYEIKLEINVFGVSCTYELINRLNTNIWVSAVVVAGDAEQAAPYNPKSYAVIPPAKEGSIHGTPLCRFYISGRWRGCDASELKPLLYLNLPANTPHSAPPPAPVRLGAAPTRRSVALIDSDGHSVAVVVTQVLHQCRWLVIVAKDPCPQFVLRNGSAAPLAVAQCADADDSTTKVVAECEGAAWHCVVQPAAAVHYSAPAHAARYPLSPDAPAPPPDPVLFLTFALADVAGKYEWCAPVAAAAGEQLLQLRGRTVKLRVTPHPHTTLLDTRDVDQNDISASDIRRRLIGSFNQHHVDETSPLSSAMDQMRLDRIHADENLVVDSPKLEYEDVSAQTLILKDPNLDEAISGGAATSQEKTVKISDAADPASAASISLADNISYDNFSFAYSDLADPDWEVQTDWSVMESVRGVFAGIVICLSANADTKPLLSIHVDRVACRHLIDGKGATTTISIAELQVDNQLYETGQFDFAVVASTSTTLPVAEPFPPLWNMFADRPAFDPRENSAKMLVKARFDRWEVAGETFNELTELELRLGPLLLYIEDAYVSALVNLLRISLPVRDNSEAAMVLAEASALQRPLRLRMLLVHPLDLTLTLHTAVRMYIALDQSPLRLGAFRLSDMMTSAERLTHALTVHYLSAALLGAGWVVGGLELLGAPGALAARVGGASGGLRGVASAAAAGILRSLSSCAGSLARNLDLLAGDEEHAQRAAAARRSPPQSLLAGLAAGITNFAINILGAVGGLAHHPLVGVAVGETDSGAAALRRGLLGALAKPLSATADLVAYAGHGLLHQTGWDPLPQARGACAGEGSAGAGVWRRDCVRWAFRLSELRAIDGFQALVDEAPLLLILTHKFLVLVEPESERVKEMIELKLCSLAPYQGNVIEVRVVRSRAAAPAPRPGDDDDEYQVNAAAMARVARYTGADGADGAGAGSGAGGGGERRARTLRLLPAPAQARALHAALTALLRHNTLTHLQLL